MKVPNKSAVKTKHIRVLGTLETVAPYGSHISEFSSKFTDALSKLGDDLVATASSLEQKGNTAVMARIFREYESSLDAATPTTDFRPLVEKIIQSTTLLLAGPAQKQLVARARKVSALLDQDGHGPTHIAEQITLSEISAESLPHDDGETLLVIVLKECEQNCCMLNNLQHLARVLPDVVPQSTLVVIRKCEEPRTPADLYLHALLRLFEELGGWVTCEKDPKHSETIREFISQD